MIPVPIIEDVWCMADGRVRVTPAWDGRMACYVWYRMVFGDPTRLEPVE